MKPVRNQCKISGTVRDPGPRQITFLHEFWSQNAILGFGARTPHSFWERHAAQEKVDLGSFLRWSGSSSRAIWSRVNRVRIQMVVNRFELANRSVANRSVIRNFPPSVFVRLPPGSQTGFSKRTFFGARTRKLGFRGALCRRTSPLGFRRPSKRAGSAPKHAG